MSFTAQCSSHQFFLRNRMARTSGVSDTSHMSEAARSRVSALTMGPSIWSSAGALAARAWLHERNITSPEFQRWYAHVVLGVADRPPAQLDERTATYFRLEIYSEEWGYFFGHAKAASWIRVTDTPFVHGRDDYRLLARTPPLREIGQLVRALERQHGLAFRREHALVRTNLAGAETRIRAWVQTL